MNIPILRRPDRRELPDLAALCLRSKAVWGYDAAFLDLCRPVLRVDPAQLRRDLVRVAETSGHIAGVVQVSVEDGEAELDLLFVEPGFMRRGTGAILLDWATRAAQARGARRLSILSDPGARAFYERRGAVFLREAPSDAVPGRRLPLLAVDLTPPTRISGGRRASATGWSSTRG